MMKTYEIARVGADMLIDPKRCILQCEQQLSARLEEAAAQCLRASRRDPVLLLSGPSGAGKTTTAHKLAQSMTRMGRSGQVLSDEIGLPVYGTDRILPCGATSAWFADGVSI